MEQCMQCYINKRLETLLLPWAKNEYPWDLNDEILLTLREKSKEEVMYSHDHKGSQPSSLLIDRLFDKTKDPTLSDEHYESDENIITIPISIEDLSDRSEIPGLTSSTSSSEFSDSEMEESNELNENLELVSPQYLSFRNQ